MKNLHGYAREHAIDEMLNKLDLLEQAGKEWGLEEKSTIELYLMKESGASYKQMLAYYKEVNSNLEEEFGL